MIWLDLVYWCINIGSLLKWTSINQSINKFLGWPK